MLVFLFFFYQARKYCLIFDSAMLVVAFHSLPKAKYSNPFIVAAFSGNFFPDKTSLWVKNSYLLTYPNDKAKILAVCLSKLN